MKSCETQAVTEKVTEDKTIVLYQFPPSIDTDKSIVVPKREVGGGVLTCFNSPPPSPKRNFKNTDYVDTIISRFYVMYPSA
jgi:hypothetical protein